MATSTRELHDCFRHSFGVSLTEALIRLAARAHERAPSVVSAAGVEQHQAHDLMPSVRRALFESEASKLSLPGVRVTVRKTSGGGSHFVEFAAQDAVMTSLTRAFRPRSLPLAWYRETRAQSAQPSLFDVLNGAPPSDAPLFGCFVYGGRGKRLSLASVYFPIPGFPLTTVEPLDLLHAHAQVLEDERAQKRRPAESDVELVVAMRKNRSNGKA